MKNLDGAFTSKYWTWTYLYSGQHPDTLLAALSSHLTHLEPDSWAQRFALGGVYLNGLPAAGDCALSAPCKIEYYEPTFPIDQAAAHFPKFDTRQVLFEDEDLLVAFKPAGISSMPARDQNVFHFKAQLENYIGRTVHMPSRIDMSTQGLVIVSASDRMNRSLQHIFQYRRIEKTYLLRSANSPNWETQELNAPIGRDPEHPVLRKVHGHSAREALTKFRVLGKMPDGGSALEAKPHTGRTHQIRVHAAHLGIPVRGDKFYGGAKHPLLNLMSYRLQLMHPFTQGKLDLRVPPELLPEWATEIPGLLERGAAA